MKTSFSVLFVAAKLLLVVVALSACSTPATKPNRSEAQPIKPQNPLNITRCWATEEITACWPIGTKPSEGLQPILELKGEPLICKQDVCEPLIRQEI